MGEIRNFSPNHPRKAPPEGDLQEGKEARKEPEVLFLNIEHGLSDVEKVWGMAEDADIILMEAVGTEPATRELMETVANLLCSDRTPEAETAREELLRFLLSHRTFACHIMAKAVEAGKEFHFIDIPEGVEGWQEAQRAQEAEKQISKLMEVGQAVEAFWAYQEMNNSVLQSLPKRESYVMKQLREKTEEGLQWKGKKVAVIQGVAHTKIFHEFRKLFPDISTARKFPEMPYLYPYGVALVRRTYFYPEKPITRNDYLRAFLGDKIVEPALRTEGLEGIKIRQVSLKLLESLSAKELGKAPVRYEVLYREGLETFHYLRDNFPGEKFRALVAFCTKNLLTEKLLQKKGIRIESAEAAET